jgi:putative inorganic carbon (hco3(-)) transporter
VNRFKRPRGRTPNSAPRTKRAVPDLPGSEAGQATTHVSSNAKRMADGAIRALLLGVVVTVPLVFSPRTIGSGYIKNVFLALLVLAACAVWLLKTIWQGEIRWPRQLLTRAVLVYWLVAGISVLTSQSPLISAWAFWRITLFVLLFFLVAGAFTTRRQILLLLAALCGTAVVVAAYAVIQKAGHDPFQWSQVSDRQPFSTLGNPNFLATYLVFIIPVAIGLTFSTRSWGLQLLGGIAALGGFLALILTLCKGAWLALLVGLGVLVSLLLFSRKWPAVEWTRRKKRFMLLGLLAAGAVLWFATPIVVERFRSSFHTSADVRLVYWEGALGIIWEAPLLGKGLGTFQVSFPSHRPLDFRERRVGYNVMHAHSEYLQTLAEQGVLGLIALLFLIGAAAWTVIRSLHHSPNRRWLLAGLLSAQAGVLAHSLVGVALRWTVCPALFWVSIGILGALSAQIPPAIPTRQRGLRCGWIIRPGLSLGTLGFALCMAWYCVWRPFQAELLLRSGDRAMARGQWQLAEQALQRAITLDRTLLGAYYRLGGVYYETGDYSRSLDVLLALQKYAPDYVKVRYNLGVTYAALQRWREAGAELARAQKTGVIPKNVSIEQMVGKIKQIQTDKGQYVSLLEGFLALNPEDKQTWNKLAARHLQLRQLDEAQTACHRALAIDGDYVPALSNLAGIFFFRGNLEDAIAACRRILEINPNDVIVNINLGRAYYRRGEYSTALDHWRTALSIEPNNREAQQLLRQAEDPDARPGSPGNP